MRSGRGAARVATFHYLRYRAFAHETEDRERVRKAVLHAAHAEKAVALDETEVEGSHKNRILILEAEVTGAPAAKRMFAGLARDDPDGFARLRTELPSRLDEHHSFYLRLDKQEAYLGRTKLARDEDAIVVRGKVRTFGAKRGLDPAHLAVTEMEAFLSGIAARPGQYGENIEG